MVESYSSTADGDIKNIPILLFRWTMKSGNSLINTIEINAKNNTKVQLQERSTVCIRKNC